MADAIGNHRGQHGAPGPYLSAHISQRQQIVALQQRIRRDGECDGRAKLMGSEPGEGPAGCTGAQLHQRSAPHPRDDRYGTRADDCRNGGAQMASPP